MSYLFKFSYAQKSVITRFYFFIFLLACSFQTHSQNWRSTLYPEDWKPGYKDSESRFLHDFSYAGYHAGEKQIPIVSNNIVDVTKTPYFADKTGTADVQLILQKALDDIGKAGGGVVYLPEGTYKINVSASLANTIKMNYSNVVLRGDGPGKTFILNSNSNIRNTSVITIKPVAGGDWFNSGTNFVSITEDVANQSNKIPVTSVTSYKVGDWIVIRSDLTSEFIQEHGMKLLWGTNIAGPAFYRIVKSVESITNTITIDAPVRYWLKKRDNARISKVIPVLSETGIENLSIGNVQSVISGMGDLDFDKAGTGAYEIHNSNLIYIQNSVNCWLKNIHTFKPSSNSGDFHLCSNGIQLNRSRFITVESCNFEKPQYEGEGGNGYMYILAGNDCLIKESTANHSRHNYDFKSMQSNGNVILRCRGENSRLASDFHMHFSMSNLFDNFTANKDFLEAKFRPYGTFPSMHGHPTTESVFWNTKGEAYPSGKTAIVESAQFGWGYIIGTKGAANAVKTTPVSGTASNFAYDSSPEDFKEGIGKGELLSPESLYEDQLMKRLSNLNVNVNIKGKPESDIMVTPNPSNTGLFFVDSANEVLSYRIINTDGKELIAENRNHGNSFQIGIKSKGVYVLLLKTSEKLSFKKLIVN